MIDETAALAFNPLRRLGWILIIVGVATLNPFLVVGGVLLLCGYRTPALFLSAIVAFMLGMAVLAGVVMAFRARRMIPLAQNNEVVIIGTVIFVLLAGFSAITLETRRAPVWAALVPAGRLVRWFPRTDISLFFGALYGVLVLLVTTSANPRKAEALALAARPGANEALLMSFGTGTRKGIPYTRATVLVRTDSRLEKAVVLWHIGPEDATVQWEDAPDVSD